MRRLFAMVAPLLFSGCSLVELHLSITDLCHTWQGVSVPGSPVDGTLVHTFELDSLDEATQIVDLGASVDYLEIDVRAASGFEDLRFVERVVVSAGELQLLDCDASCVMPDGTLHLEPMVPDAILARAAEGDLAITVAITGPAPPGAWTVDLDACATATATLDP